MRTDINDKDVNMCFACSTQNPIGLKLHFTMDGDVCRSSFTGGPNHQGWSGYLHGGIISTLLDEVMAQWIWLKKIHAMTAEMTTRFSRPVPINVPLTLEALNSGERGKLFIMESKIILPDGDVPCRSTAKFLKFSKESLLK
jgi:acyl-coenzyme A thioesterase PaaI-like protein